MPRAGRHDGVAPTIVPPGSDERSGAAGARVISSLREEVRRESGWPACDEFSFARLRMPRAPHWSVVWSDLMMTMFIFFAVLYIYQSSHQELRFGEGDGTDFGAGAGTGVMGLRGGGAIGPAGEPADEHLARIFDLGRLTLDAGSMREFARVDLAPDKTVRIILTGDLLFDSASAELKAGAVQGLEKIIPLVAQTPYMINVAGHTDDVPIQTRAYPSNWELSLARAGLVARFLMQETGLPENRFSVTGHAAGRPVAANDSAAHRAANRRVEIILTRDMPAAPGSAGQR
jgi:outer membrane protein OmpA-like peptidoglycan-associated protein